MEHPLLEELFVPTSVVHTEMFAQAGTLLHSAGTSVFVITDESLCITFAMKGLCQEEYCMWMAL